MFFQLGDVLLRIVARGLDDFHAGFDDRLAEFCIRRRLQRREYGQVDAEGLVGQVAAALDLLFQVLRRRLGEGGDEAERAGIYGKAHYEHFADPMQAVRGADLVTTDVWTSMGFEAEDAERKRDFSDWQVDADMMRLAGPAALFMHCLPAHRGEEVSAEVIDGPQSVVWDEAENRLHTQKALMEFLLLGKIA